MLTLLGVGMILCFMYLIMSKRLSYYCFNSHPIYFFLLLLGALVITLKV
jgi:Mg2+/citrate symporter